VPAGILGDNIRQVRKKVEKNIKKKGIYTTQKGRNNTSEI